MNCKYERSVKVNYEKIKAEPIYLKIKIIRNC